MFNKQAILKGITFVSCGLFITITIYPWILELGFASPFFVLAFNFLTAILSIFLVVKNSYFYKYSGYLGVLCATLILIFVKVDVVQAVVNILIFLIFYSIYWFWSRRPINIFQK